MDEIKIKIKVCLIRLNVDPTHKGFVQLSDCVEKCIELQTKNMKTIYSAVSEKYGIKSKSVMRNISYALNQVDDLASRLSDLMGFPIDANSLHNGKIIIYLAELVTEPALFDFHV